MPTGYTSDLYYGKEQTFEDFILKSSRAMGAFIMQRDDDSDARPAYRKENDYYRKSLLESQVKLTKWTKMTDEEKYEVYLDQMDERKRSNAERIAESDARKTRYEAMLAKVDAWDVPEKIDFFQKFAREQLKSSIDWDCKPYAQPIISFDDWAEDYEKEIVRSVTYDAKTLREERQRIVEQNEITTLLYTSLGLEPPVDGPFS